MMTKVQSWGQPRIKEEKNSSLFDKFIEKVIQHIGAVYTSVQDVSVKDVVQTIQDKNCSYITGTGDSDSDKDDDDDDDVISPIDVMKTSEKGELTKTVYDTITSCFNHLTVAHSMVKETFIEEGHLVHVLLKKGLALLLEAMTTRCIVVQDTKALIFYRRQRFIEESEMKAKCAPLTSGWKSEKNCMLPNWRHQIFYNSTKHVKIGKVATAITVYPRFAFGERPRDVPLTTVGQQFAIGQRNARKVVTGKLYAAKGKELKIFLRKPERFILMILLIGMRRWQMPPI